MEGLFWLVVVTAIYMIPTIVAYSRRHRLTAPILVINGLLGWTVLGWIVALAMAVGPAGSRADRHGRRRVL